MAGLAADCELVVSELATNAVQAARRLTGPAVPLPVRLRFTGRPPGVQVEVWDGQQRRSPARLAYLALRPAHNGTAELGMIGAGYAQPGGLRARPGGKGRRVSAAGPLRGPGKGGGFAAAGLVAPAKGTGPPPRPQGCCASRCARRPCGPPLSPGTPAAPEGQEERAGHSLPAARRGRDKASPSWP